MTERQAWRWIALRRAHDYRRYARHGLCFQVVEMRNQGQISTRQAKWMLARLMNHVDAGRLHAYDRTVPRPDATGGRILAALWMALES